MIDRAEVFYLFEGAMNHINKNLEWSTENFVYSKTGQHGGKFNGNPCKKMVINWSLFLSQWTEEFSLFAYYHRDLDAVIHSGFGMKLGPEFKQK